MSFRTFLVGRGRSADIRLADPTISRLHAELTVTSSGEYYLTDRNTPHGTWLRRDRRWIRLIQGRVGPMDRIRLGRYQDVLFIMLERASLDLRIGQPSFEQVIVAPKTIRGTDTL